MAWIPLRDAWPPLNKVVFVIDATGGGADPNIIRAVWRGQIDGGYPVMLLARDEESQTPGVTWAWTTPQIVREWIKGYVFTKIYSNETPTEEKK